MIKNFHKGNILADIGEFEIYPKDPETMKNPDLVVKTDGTPEALRTIKAAVAEILTDRNDVDRVVQNLEEEVASQFDEERNVLHIVLMFTGIALLISIFGFIGLSLFFIRQRRNEVAVRRIMGGSVREVIVLMLTKFCAPLLMSCIVAGLQLQDSIKCMDIHSHLRGFAAHCRAFRAVADSAGRDAQPGGRNQN